MVSPGRGTHWHGSFGGMPEMATPGIFTEFSLFGLKLSRWKCRICFRRSPRGRVDRSPVSCPGFFLSTDVFISQPISLP
jgi:hypothetical protein